MIFKRLLFFLLFLGAAGAGFSQSKPKPNEQALEALFGKTEGTMWVENEQGQVVLAFNQTRAKKRFSPCSTFKIPHSLMALDHGVVSSINQEFAWDGTVHNVTAWNETQNLKSAIKNSTVWVFDQIFKDLGPRRVKRDLRKMKYGNRRVKPVSGRFWLGGELAISAQEQVEFLRRMAEGKLKVSADHVDQVKKALLLESGDGWLLYGKTGSMKIRPGYGLGWFVGWIQRDGGVLPFACNLEGLNVWSGDARIVVLQALRDNGLLRASKVWPSPVKVTEHLAVSLALGNQEDFLSYFSPQAKILVPGTEENSVKLNASQYWAWLTTKLEAENAKHQLFRSEAKGNRALTRELWVVEGQAGREHNLVWEIKTGKVLSLNYELLKP